MGYYEVNMTGFYLSCPEFSLVASDEGSSNLEFCCEGCP